jgi:hypothetical protein
MHMRCKKTSRWAPELIFLTAVGSRYLVIIDVQILGNASIEFPIFTIAGLICDSSVKQGSSNVPIVVAKYSRLGRKRPT